MNTTYDQLIIGSGFAGICAAIKLKAEGEDNFIVLERNPWLGGTWWDNQYPGATCDVESHLYSYSFEPNPEWSMVFSPQEEILRYIEHCVLKYDLKKHIQFNTNVSKAVFSESSGIWSVTDALGKDYRSKVIISCAGGLCEPAYPDIPGLESFKGKMFHTSRWDKTFDLKNKTVAVVGTGASAIQVVPAIASGVKQLYLFQRTPPWIIPKPDKKISASRKWLYKHLPLTQRIYRRRLYWQHELMALGFIRNPGILKFFSKIALHYLKTSIPDETLRQNLTPKYTMGCKRILLSNDYYPSLLRQNVEVITNKIKEITEDGILTEDGEQKKVDAIIIATGFQAAENAMRFELKGRNGLDLNGVWKNGAEAYLGTLVSGFPNFFLVVGPNTGLGHSSMILMIEAQVNLVVESVKALKRKKAKFIDLKHNIQEEFNLDIQAKLAKTVWQNGGCMSWYQMKNGKNVTLWPGFTFDFMKRTKKFEAENFEIG